MGSSYSDFIENMGFLKGKNPFSTFTSEHEQEYASEIFVEQSVYSSFEADFESGKSMFLVGNRGTGKTALLYKFQRQVDQDKYPLTFIDDYEELPNPYTLKDLYNFLIKKISVTLFTTLASNPGKIKKLDVEDRVFLSYILVNFVDKTTKRELQKTIEEIQLSWIRRAVGWIGKKIRQPANYASGVALAVLDQAILTGLNLSVQLPEKFPEVFPQFSNGADVEFNHFEINYHFFNRFLDLFKALGFSGSTVILDKIDEDPRFNNNGELISNFIKPLASNSKLLLNKNIQLVISLWYVPYKYSTDFIRTQKYPVHIISWEDDDLRRALNRRISYFSGGKITDYRMLFESLTDAQDQEILSLSNNNPRDLWHIFDQLIFRSYKHDNYTSKILKRCFDNALEHFVTGFNYYEYYPKSPNARSNTMDFYSYANLLLKLDDFKFTKNVYSRQTGAGSSTNNYVYTMTRMGLIIELPEKIHNSVQFAINDPKVTFAMKHNLSISKNSLG